MPHVGPPSPLRDPASRLFINLYFVGTGIHAIHLTIGILLVLGLCLRIAKRWTPLPERAGIGTPIGTDTPFRVTGAGAPVIG